LSGSRLRLSKGRTAIDFCGSDPDEHDHQSHNPIWNLQEWENLRGDLNQQPADNGVSDGNLVNVSPLQLPKEVPSIHGVALATQSIHEQDQHLFQIALIASAKRLENLRRPIKVIWKDRRRHGISTSRIKTSSLIHYRRVGMRT